MSQKPTPEEVLTAWDSESAKWNTWLKANNATSDIIAEALREALAQRDELAAALRYISYQSSSESNP